MNLNLENKVIIVTGGASGIGYGIVRNLLEEGAIVCILDNNPNAESKIRNDNSTFTEKIFYAVVELTNVNECTETVNQIIKKFNHIDGLVNNAGLNDGVSLEHGNADKFLASLDKNVSHYELMKILVLPHLKLNGGHIVNISSKTAETGQGGTSGYAAANGVRMELTKEWAQALESFGIRVNSVVVAECFTPQYEWWIGQQISPEKKLKAINAKIPLGNRMTTIEEIAAMVLFLLSDKSSAFNGQLMHVDGGYVHLDRAIG